MSITKKQFYARINSLDVVLHTKRLVCGRYLQTFSLRAGARIGQAMTDYSVYPTKTIFTLKGK